MSERAKRILQMALLSQNNEQNSENSNNHSGSFEEISPVEIEIPDNDINFLLMSENFISPNTEECENVVETSIVDLSNEPIPVINVELTQLNSGSVSAVDNQLSSLSNEYNIEECEKIIKIHNLEFNNSLMPSILNTNIILSTSPVLLNEVVAVASVQTDSVIAADVKSNSIGEIVHADPDFKAQLKIVSDKENQLNIANISDDTDERELRPELKRKRSKKMDSANWDKNRTKTARMKGMKYNGYKRDKQGKVTRCPERMERKLGPICESDYCKKLSTRYCSKLTELDRSTIFKHFWQEMDWQERKVYVSSLIDYVPAKKTTVKSSTQHSRRSKTFIYNLKINCKNQKVCKKTFLNTLGLKEWMAHNWVRQNYHSIMKGESSEDDEEEVHKDNLKRSKRRRNTEDPGVTFAKQFLEILPKMPSHYCRKRTSKLYLEPIFATKMDLYKTYLDKCKSENQTYLCRSKFLSIFEKENLSLFQPKKDRCDTCCAFETKNINEEVWLAHRQKKERAAMEKDKELANKGSCYMLTMDLQAVKLSPLTKASAFYYKTKLCSHNFTVYNVASHQATNYWWNETEAELTASTFASCIIDYLKEHCVETKRPVIIYSDGCTYQNRNVTIANALLHFAKQNDLEIQQKYLVKGHTHMECDSVHACIERKVKNKEIYVPADYIIATKKARTKPFPYNVKYLSYEFFSDYTHKELQYYDSIRPGKKKGDPVVTELVALKYCVDGIMYKLHFDDEYQNIPRRASKVDINAVPVQLYQSKIKIPFSKWKHLQELKSVIPSDFHAFYDNLLYEK